MGHDDYCCCRNIKRRVMRSMSKDEGKALWTFVRCGVGVRAGICNIHIHHSIARLPLAVLSFRETWFSFFSFLFLTAGVLRVEWDIAQPRAPLALARLLLSPL